MRLIAFGCSLTYGHGLPDCWDPVEQQPLDKSSSFAWPEVVAKKLNLTCINTSFPGASNKEILFKLQNFDFHSNDVVAIQWTFPDRSCIIPTADNIFIGAMFDHSIYHRIIPGNTDTVSKSFYFSYHDVDATIDSYTRIEHANLYLKSRGINAVHFLVDRRFVTDYNWFTTPLQTVYMSDVRERHSCALDGQHPGELAHHEFGLEVAKKINSFISC